MIRIYLQGHYLRRRIVMEKFDFCDKHCLIKYNHSLYLVVFCVPDDKTPKQISALMAQHTRARFERSMSALVQQLHHGENTTHDSTQASNKHGKRARLLIYAYSYRRNVVKNKETRQSFGCNRSNWSKMLCSRILVGIDHFARAIFVLCRDDL